MNVNFEKTCNMFFKIFLPIHIQQTTGEDELTMPDRNIIYGMRPNE